MLYNDSAILLDEYFLCTMIFVVFILILIFILCSLNQSIYWYSSAGKNWQFEMKSIKGLGKGTSLPIM